MEQIPDWVSMVNVNLADHEARLQCLEHEDGLDDAEPAKPLGNVGGSDGRMLRAIEHRLLAIEVELRELTQVLRSAMG